MDRKKLVDSILLKDSRKMLVSSCVNSFFPSPALTSVFILNESNLSMVYINNWRTFLEKMHKLGEHTFTMKTCIMIYEGKIKYLPLVPVDQPERKEIMKADIRKLTIDYLANCLRVCKNNPDEVDMVSNTIISLMEFLVECEDVSFLFEDVWRMLYQHRYEDVFFECLEPFIVMKKIR